MVEQTSQISSGFIIFYDIEVKNLLFGFMVNIRNDLRGDGQLL